ARVELGEGLVGAGFGHRQRGVPGLRTGDGNALVGDQGQIAIEQQRAEKDGDENRDQQYAALLLAPASSGFGTTPSAKPILLHSGFQLEISFRKTTWAVCTLSVLIRWRTSTVREHVHVMLMSLHWARVGAGLKVILVGETVGARV